MERGQDAAKRNGGTEAPPAARCRPRGRPPHNRMASIPKRAFIHQRNWPVADVSADLISALAKGTHLDIAATDQIRPIATTTVIPIPVRI